MSWLPAEHFVRMVADMPLVSIDLVVRNPEGEALLGQRLNRPAQGCWFVPGGRIRKDERIPQAFARLVREELGVDISFESAEFLGVYEHHYSDNFSGADFSTHYVVLAYELMLDLSLSALPVEQHGSYRWWPSAELLTSPDVHLHTQWYFQNH
jgi:colanic acid biosynthesis protein WcaH